MSAPLPSTTFPATFDEGSELRHATWLRAALQGPEADRLMAIKTIQATRSSAKAAKIVLRAAFTPYIDAFLSAHPAEAFGQMKSLAFEEDICPISILDGRELTGEELLRALTLIKPHLKRSPEVFFPLLFAAAESRDDPDLLERILCAYDIPTRTAAHSVSTLRPWQHQRPYLKTRNWLAAQLGKLFTEDRQGTKEVIEQACAMNSVYVPAAAVHQNIDIAPLIQPYSDPGELACKWGHSAFENLSSKHGRLRALARLHAIGPLEEILTTHEDKLTHILVGL